MSEGVKDGLFEGIEIRSYLQPIFSFKTQDLLGFKALYRGFKNDNMIIVV
jgi:EAL domain-containing protein (putative c-di-GMP-specific phosphodiesterase class I)